MDGGETNMNSDDKKAEENSEKSVAEESKTEEAAK